MRGPATLARTLFAALNVALAGVAGARADNSVEYAVKGAYLYKFLPFVDWPASAFPAVNTPYVICLLGRDPFGTGLDRAVTDIRLNGRAIVIRRMESPDSTCHVAYLGYSDSAATEAALRALSGRSVLTVTDSGEPPGVIGFVIEGDHVRFNIDDAQAARDGLSISSKLLSLAHAVKSRGGQP